jgi:hypothetical protein
MFFYGIFQYTVKRIDLFGTIIIISTVIIIVYVEPKIKSCVAVVIVIVALAADEKVESIYE